MPVQACSKYPMQKLSAATPKLKPAISKKRVLKLSPLATD